MAQQSLTYSRLLVRATTWVPLICCIGMVAGLMFSRAVLSISMILMFAVALLPGAFQRNWKAFKKSRFALFSALFFASYLISGLWSADKSTWLDITINKLPFLVLPFSFLGLRFRNLSLKRILIVAVIGMHLAVVLYSLMRFAMRPDFYIAGYEVSHPLPTTRYNDHIRFSLSIVLTILMGLYLLFEIRRNPAWLKFIVGLSILLFVVYLHILAVKTGLICLYLMLFVFGLYKARQAGRKVMVVTIAGMLLFPILAYFTMPTFRAKLGYVRYELEQAKTINKYDYNLSDAGRMISYHVAIKAIEEHMLIGAGPGDLMEEMDRYYGMMYPHVPPSHRLIPHNQYLATALGVGLPLSLFLIYLVLVPLKWPRGSSGIYAFATGLILAVALLSEAMLEVQFGVFTFLFYSLFWLIPGMNTSQKTRKLHSRVASSTV